MSSSVAFSNQEITNDYILEGAEYTSVFKRGSANILARYDLPMLKFRSDLAIEVVQSQLESWNQFMGSSMPGVGYYVSCPFEDVNVPKFHNFVIMCDDEFYDAFKESVTLDEIVELPSVKQDVVDDLDFDSKEYDRFISFK